MQSCDFSRPCHNVTKGPIIIFLTPICTNGYESSIPQDSLHTYTTPPRSPHNTLESGMMEIKEELLYLVPGDDSKKSGCRSFDVLFRKPFPNWNAIQFNNKNTYSISILSQSKICTSWKALLLDYLLLSNPHSVGRSSENWVTLLREDFMNTVENVARLRILLRQPSPHWSEFGITNFALVHRGRPAVEENNSSRHFKMYEIDFLN